LATSLEGTIEFPLDVEDVNREELSSKLKFITDELEHLIEDSSEGRVLREGVKLSIIGEPNVGKSSLLNRLLENERAIVTNIPGTTRDTIEEKLVLQGWPLVLVDTAGIREHNMLDEAEEYGIQRTKKAVEKSDLVLLVKDLSKQEEHDSLKLYELIKDKPRIVVGNKVDLIESNGKPMACDVEISATQGTNVAELKLLIIEKIKESIKARSNNTSIFVNERQKELLVQTKTSLQFVMEQSKKEIPDDLIADELKKSISKLDEITGQGVNDDVIKNIFAKFCVGK
ncbi:MAG: GTP-binding protein, partial [Candidatus Melainabacteria bacterium]|nr:GTP-binding protein [Candidatus Melainabacteria bacterium]